MDVGKVDHAAVRTVRPTNGSAPARRPRRIPSPRPSVGHDGAWPSRSLLGRLDPAVRQQLIGRCRPVEFDPGRRLLHQGSGDGHALLIYHGMVKIHLVDRDGYEALLAVRQRGELVGELGALSGRPRSASVLAVNTVVAGRMSAGALIDFLADHPDAARAVIGILGERLEWANLRRVDFATRSAHSKIAHVLADLAADVDERGGPYCIQLSQQDLASIVGISVNTAQAALRRLEAEGLVDRGYREVTVVDLDRLVRFAESGRQIP